MADKKSSGQERLQVAFERYLEHYNNHLRRRTETLERSGIPMLVVRSGLPQQARTQDGHLHGHPECPGDTRNYNRGNARAVARVDLGDLSAVCTREGCGELILSLETVRYIQVAQYLVEAVTALCEAGIVVPWYTQVGSYNGSQSGSGWLDAFSDNRAQKLAQDAQGSLREIICHLEGQDSDASRTLLHLARAANDAPWPGWEKTALSTSDHYRLVGSLLEAEPDVDAGTPGYNAIVNLHKSTRMALTLAGEHNWSAAQTISRTLVDTSVPARPEKISELQDLPLPREAVQDPYGYLVGTWRERVRLSITNYRDTFLEEITTDVTLWQKAELAPRLLHTTGGSNNLQRDLLASHPHVTAAEGTLVLVHPLVADALLHGKREGKPLMDGTLSIVGEIQGCGGEIVHPASGARSGDLAALEIVGKLWAPAETGPANDLGAALEMALSIARE